jgi:hypothetical protein
MVLDIGIDGVDSLLHARLASPRLGTTRQMKISYCIARQGMMVILRQEISILFSILSPEDKAKMQEVQRSWEQFFIKQKSFFTSVMEDYPAFRDYGLGTMHGTMKEQWLYDMVKAQTQGDF